MSSSLTSTLQENDSGEGPMNDVGPSDRPKMSQAASTSMSRPNHQLTAKEKHAKKLLKRHLKQRTRIRKYEMRWSQAVSRKDSGTASQAAEELKYYLEVLRGEPDSLWHQPDFPSKYHDFLDDPDGRCHPATLGGETNAVGEGRRWMNREIWQKLILRMLPSDTRDLDSGPDDEGEKGGRLQKRQQTMQARSLLAHMTKGTQTENMFENDAAIIGYTRQKFMERALLAVKSLERLRPLESPLWSALLNVRSALSIGCGPGCDAAGIITFLQNERDSSPVLDRLVLVDYVMPQWKRLVLDHLRPIISPFVGEMHTATCDVRYSLNNDSNTDTRKCLGGDESVDLIVVSYLLTETREQWKTFFQDLLNHQTKKSLILLSEPTAWQLHCFMDLFSEIVENYQWLDSSRDSLDLQPLEGRLGPAVVLLQTRPKVLTQMDL